MEPKSLTDASFKATNSLDGLVTGVDFDVKKQLDDQIDAIVQAVVANDYDVTGLALSPAAGQALAQVKVNGVVQYPEFRFGQNPDAFYGMTSDVNKTLATKGATSETIMSLQATSKMLSSGAIQRNPARGHRVR